MKKTSITTHRKNIDFMAANEKCLRGMDTENMGIFKYDHMQK